MISSKEALPEFGIYEGIYDIFDISKDWAKLQ